MLYHVITRTLLFSFLCMSSFFTSTQNTQHWAMQIRQEDSNQSSTEEEPQKRAVQPAPVTNFNTTNNANPVYTTNIDPHVIVNTNSVITAVGMKIGDIFVSMAHKIQDTVTTENFDLLKKVVKSLLWQHRYKITGGIFLGSYTTTSLFLLTDYHRIDDMFWAHWKNKSTFEELCAIPQKELARELMLAIGRHHVNKDNPTNLASPLISFIKEIDYEITVLKRYIKTVKIVQYLHLTSIFPTNQNKLNRARRMLERVLFIKHIFLSWLADYNLAGVENINSEKTL